MTTMQKITLKKFSDKELSKAKKLLKDFVNEEITMEECQQSDFFHVLPALFTYNFPKESSDNEQTKISKGIDSSVLYEDDDNNKVSFELSFKCKFFKNDYGYINELISSMLPEAMYAPYEYSIAFDTNLKSPPTIKDVIILLSEMGFNYDPKKCIMKKYVESSIIFEESITAIDNNKYNLAVKKCITKDDVAKLKDFLDQGINVNAYPNKNEYYLVEAVNHNAYKCFELLLENNAKINLSMGNHNASSIANQIIFNADNIMGKYSYPYTAKVLEKVNELSAEQLAPIFSTYASRGISEEVSKFYKIMTNLLDKNIVDYIVMSSLHNVNVSNPDLVKEVVLSCSEENAKYGAQFLISINRPKLANYIIETRGLNSDNFSQPEPMKIKDSKLKIKF